MTDEKLKDKENKDEELCDEELDKVVGGTSRGGRWSNDSDNDRCD